MTGMKDLSDQFKLSVRSIAEVFGILNDLDTTFGRSRKVTFCGRRLTRAAIVNAAIAHIALMDREHQQLALSAGASAVESWLSEDATEKYELMQKAVSHLVPGTGPEKGANPGEPGRVVQAEPGIPSEGVRPQKKRGG